MTANVDWSKGGNNPNWTLRDFGPSIGWAWAPQQNLLAITTAGTAALDPSITLVTVNVVASGVVIILPTSIVPSGAGAALAQPSLFARSPVTIVDIGGNAFTYPITISPQAGESIMGLSSLTLNVNFQGVTLMPDGAGLWSMLSP
jgi:hypothetical protein